MKNWDQNFVSSEMYQISTCLQIDWKQVKCDHRYAYSHFDIRWWWVGPSQNVRNGKGSNLWGAMGGSYSMKALEWEQSQKCAQVIGEQSTGSYGWEQFYESSGVGASLWERTRIPNVTTANGGYVDEVSISSSAPSEAEKKERGDAFS